MHGSNPCTSSQATANRCAPIHAFLAVRPLCAPQPQTARATAASPLAAPAGAARAARDAAVRELLQGGRRPAASAARRAARTLQQAAQLPDGVLLQAQPGDDHPPAGEPTAMPCSRPDGWQGRTAWLQGCSKPKRARLLAAGDWHCAGPLTAHTGRGRRAVPRACLTHALQAPHQHEQQHNANGYRPKGKGEAHMQPARPSHDCRDSNARMRALSCALTGCARIHGRASRQHAALLPLLLHPAGIKPYQPRNGKGMLPSTRSVKVRCPRWRAHSCISCTRAILALTLLLSCSPSSAVPFSLLFFACPKVPCALQV